MTHFITSFDFNGVTSDDESPYTENIYAPDFTLQRKVNSHTMRKSTQRVFTHYGNRYSQDYSVAITRPQCSEDDTVYVTEMDNHLSEMAFRSNYNNRVEVVLHKKELYDRFIFDIEESCVEKTTTYDKRTNANKTKYKVPVVGMLVGATKKSSYDTHVQYVKSDETQKFIMIRGKIYPINKYFRENGLDYSELHLPENYFSSTVCEDDETMYCPHKTSFAKEVLTYSFHHDMKISSIVLRPELMKFKQVSSDNRMSRYDRANPAILRKKQYHINVLENDPGFITKFEMFYRSEQTNGQWVKHGVFNGNVSNIDFTKISFDEIMAKEIRIVPFSTHKSCEHARITFIGKCKVQPKSDELFVTYEVAIPRDGKYMKKFAKVSDVSSFNYDKEDWKSCMMENKQRDKRRQLREHIVYDA